MSKQEEIISGSTPRNVIKGKLKEWGKRFLPAETLGTTLAVLASWLTLELTKNKVAAAYAGSFGDTFGFYAVIIIRDSLAMHRKLRGEDKGLTLVSFLHIFKNLLLDFGAAEILDSLFLRPFCMYIFPVLLNNYPVGVLAGKIVSDVVFYIPVIISYELRTRYSKKSS